jgi:hypothetical protein
MKYGNTNSTQNIWVKVGTQGEQLHLSLRKTLTLSLFLSSAFRIHTNLIVGGGVVGTLPTYLCLAGSLQEPSSTTSYSK